MSRYRRNEAPHGETTARWFSRDKESSVSGVTGVIVAVYILTIDEGDACSLKEQAPEGNELQDGDGLLGKWIAGLLPVVKVHNDRRRLREPEVLERLRGK